MTYALRKQAGGGYSPALSPSAKGVVGDEIREETFGHVPLGGTINYPEVSTCVTFTVVYDSGDMVGMHMTKGAASKDPSALARWNAMLAFGQTLVNGSSVPSSSSSSSSSSQGGDRKVVTEIYVVGVFSVWRALDADWFHRMTAEVLRAFCQVGDTVRIYQWPQKFDSKAAAVNYRIRIPGAHSDSLWHAQRSNQKTEALPPGGWKYIHPTNVGFQEWMSDQNV